MPNKRYGQVANGHGKDGKGSKEVGQSATPKMTIKQSFTHGQLPGKASNWYGVKGKAPVKQPYAASKGLC